MDSPSNSLLEHARAFVSLLGSVGLRCGGRVVSTRGSGAMAVGQGAHVVFLLVLRNRGFALGWVKAELLPV